MDKSWMNLPQDCEEYNRGLELFLDFAFRSESHGGEILCPCIHCKNYLMQSREECRVHLICDGFLKGYTRWFFHGEVPLPSSNNGGFGSSSRNVLQEKRGLDMDGLLNDAFGETNLVIYSVEIEEQVEIDQIMGESPTSKVDELMEEAQKELFPGCTSFSKLSFLLHLFHIKFMKGWDKESFEMTLQLFIDANPGTNLPRTYYKCKKIIDALGLGYKKIHACRNDCMLYLGERASQEVCHLCDAPRWKIKRKPAKVLRYFPLIPRLKRLFMSSKTAVDMRWHAESRVNDGLLRHPADGEAWKSFDLRYPDFSSEIRNVRIGLSSDGFNPYRNCSSKHSTWPVVLVPYNLPPWIGMKQSSFIISMIIPGPLSPGNDIDIYLQPLIDELNELWEGVETFDSFKKETFKMRAVLMWTINDFPAYANLSGWSTKGKFACPYCMENTEKKWLYNSNKHCYMGHRRWLPERHPFRRQKQFFDGTEEHRPAPNRPTGSSLFKQVKFLSFTLGKNPLNKKTKKRKKKNINNSTNNEKILNSWKKRSVFFNLPYWEHNLLRHNLDVMHIEKNVCDNLIGTLLNIEHKSKDSENARLDLVDMNIRHDLHQIRLENKKKSQLPLACFTMSQVERETLCKIIKGIKTPNGYASNLSRCFNGNQLKISGLKSHDCHVLIEEILPLALQSCSPSKQILIIVIELAAFFRYLCSKVLDIAQLDRLQERFILTLCNMEKYFMPSFFTIMVHLTIHLIDEAKLGGPVHYRWMYPFERYFVRLKSYVRNRACPEGSIAEAYVADECLTFCSRYLEGVQTRFNRPSRNPNASKEQGLYLFESGGQHIGQAKSIDLDSKSLVQAHRYVLRHCDDIETFRIEFIELEKQKNGILSSRTINKLMNEKFHRWFQTKVMKMEETNLSKRVKALARGPNNIAMQFSGYSINGFRFHTKDRELGLTTQNSGVVNVSEIDGVNYYGKLNDIIEINYYGDFKVVLFKCDWVNVHHNSGKKVDKFGFTFVNFHRLIHTGRNINDDPFVFASQVEQVFYVEDLQKRDWSLVVKTIPRDFFDMGKAVVPHVLHTSSDLLNFDEQPCWIRNDEGTSANSSE